tara:strand:- start:4987 stop:8325 length:3339 start_codon:yes stop_codon:yes gene_type:complete
MSDDNRVKIDFLTDTPIFDRKNETETLTIQNNTVLSEEEAESNTIKIERDSALSEIDPSTFTFIREEGSILDTPPEAFGYDPFTVSAGEGFGIAEPVYIPFPVLGSDGCPTTPTIITPGLAPIDSEWDDYYFERDRDYFLDSTLVFEDARYNEHKEFSKKVNYIDTNLIKGSNDNFRNFIGFYYQLHQDDLGQSEYKFNYPAAFVNSVHRRSSGGLIERKKTAGVDAAERSVFFSSIQFPRGFSKVHNKALMTLRTTMLLTSDNEDLIENDENWRQFVIGGIFNNKEYKGLLTKGYGEETVFNCTLPLEYQSAKSVGLSPDILDTAADTVKIESVTNYSLPMYEDYLDLIGNSLLIPNYYQMMFHNQEIDDDRYIPPRPEFVKKYYSLVNKFSSIKNLMPVITPYPPPEEFKEADIRPIDAYLGDTMYIDRVAAFKKYLNSFTKTNYNPNIKNKIIRKNATHLFPFGTSNTHTNVASGFTVSTKKILPYYNLITISNRNKYFAVDTEGRPRLANIFNNLINNQASILFSNMLKKHFVEQDVINGLPTKNYAATTKTFHMSEEGKPVALKNVSNESLKYIDLYDSLVDEYEQQITDVGVSSLSSNIPYIDKLSFSKFYFESIAVNSLDQDYRLHKTIPILKLLNDVITLANTSMVGEKISPFPLPASNDSKNYFPSSYIVSPSKAKYSETIGYRIEKIEVNKLNQQRKSSSIQNTIILKNTDTGKKGNSNPIYHDTPIQYIDTQIKKGTPYEYNIYEYKIVMGYKYKIDKPLVTRKIDQPVKIIKKGSSETLYCLEFYNPYTLDTAASTFETLAKYKTEEAPYFTNAQIITPHKYLAQVALDIEPVYRIYEVPITTKEVTNTDHPPHPLEVTPYQRKDDSQVIGFHLLKENFTNHLFPIGANEEEDQIIQKYLNSQNLIKGEKIVNESKSKSRFIQIFRIDKKPTSIKDFNNAIVATKDLKLDTKRTELSVYTDCFYEEKIKTNTKLYYTFRVVSEEGVIGSFSPVFEAELIDDGNYKFAKFTKHEVRELKEKRIYNKPDRKVKKLIQLIPSAQQTVIDSEALDFSKSASEQLNSVIVGKSDNSIWGKQFKLRLTSKKTGKKIDLNVTYRLRK